MSKLPQISPFNGDNVFSWVSLFKRFVTCALPYWGNDPDIIQTRSAFEFQMAMKGKYEQWFLTLKDDVLGDVDKMCQELIKFCLGPNPFLDMQLKALTLTLNDCVSISDYYVQKLNLLNLFDLTDPDTQIKFFMDGLPNLYKYWILCEPLEKRQTISKVYELCLHFELIFKEQRLQLEKKYDEIEISDNENVGDRTPSETTPASSLDMLTKAVGKKVNDLGSINSPSSLRLKCNT